MKVEVIKGITVLKADEGKEIRRKGDTFVYGKEVWLGNSHYFRGERLSVPHKDAPEDFEEIDERVYNGGNE